jgi:5-formyltetrahydrofolate cyclo-ligase
MDKQILREEIKKKIRDADGEDIKRKSEVIHGYLGEIPEWFDAKNPCVYLSMEEEVDTRALIDKWIHEKKFSVPKWAGDSFISVKFTGWDNVKRNKWGVDEPVDIEKVPVPEIDCIIVPGLSFSKDGKRLGRGMGFYDRFLEKITAPKIGICFEFQMKENIPQDSWDQNVDMVVTEKGVYKG